MRPGEALGALAGRGAMRARRAGSSASRRRASASASGSPALRQPSIHAVAQDVAVAGDVGGEHRRAGGQTLGEDHAKALTPQRRRAQHVGASQLGAACGARRPCPARGMPRSSSVMCATSSADAPTSVSVAGTCSRSASNARSSTGRPLRSTAWPMNRMRSGATPRRRAGDPLPQLRQSARARTRCRLQRRRFLLDEPAPLLLLLPLPIPPAELHAVGHDPVAPAVEAPRRPGGRLGDGDAHMQPVHPPAPAQRDRGDAVGDRVLGVGVEGAHERQLAGVQQAHPSRPSARSARAGARRRSGRCAARGAAPDGSGQRR